MGLYSLGVPLGFLVLPVGDGWLEGGVTGRVAGAGEQLGPSFLPGPVFEQVYRHVAARGGDFRGGVNELVADGQGNGFPGSTAGEGWAASRVRLNETHASTSHAALALKTPDGKCASANTFMSAFRFSMTACWRWVLSASTVLSEAPPVFCRSYAGGGSRLRVA